MFFFIKGWPNIFSLWSSKCSIVIFNTVKSTGTNTHTEAHPPLHSVMPEPVSVCWLGGLVVVKAGTRPPRGNILPLKTMTESEVNTAKTEPESNNQATTTANKQSCGNPAWAQFPDHMSDLLKFPVSCLFWTCLRCSRPFVPNFNM